MLADTTITFSPEALILAGSAAASAAGAVLSGFAAIISAFREGKAV